MKYITSFCIGLLFSGGLIVSQMINPAVVLEFLDIFGNWNPSLLFVMGGAVLVTSVGFNLIGKRQIKPIYSTKHSFPTRSDIDPALLAGPIFFGVGWGLVGLCPGPAFASFAASPQSTWMFFLAMLFGMYSARSYARISSAKQPTPEL